MHLAQALQVSLRLKLPVLSYILPVKRKFIRRKQVDSVKEHLTRTQTDSHAVIVCLWLGYI